MGHDSSPQIKGEGESTNKPLTYPNVALNGPIILNESQKRVLEQLKRFSNALSTNIDKLTTLTPDLHSSENKYTVEFNALKYRINAQINEIYKYGKRFKTEFELDLGTSF